MRQKGIIKCDRLVNYKIRPEYVTKCDSCWTGKWDMNCKVRQGEMQSLTGFKKCNGTSSNCRG